MFIFSSRFLVSASLFTATIFSAPAWAAIFPPEEGLVNTDSTPAPTTTPATGAQPFAKTCTGGAAPQCCDTFGLLDEGTTDKLLELGELGLIESRPHLGVGCEPAGIKSW